MPSTGPSPQTLETILHTLRERGALGATSQELMRETMRYQEALIKLRHLGYKIVSANANLPYPYSSAKRYTLLMEPGVLLAAVSAEVH